MKNLFIFLSWVLLSSCGKAQSSDTPSVQSGYLYKVDPGIPGKQVYVCGERPFNANGELAAAGNIRGQTQQIFENIKTSLATVSMSMQDVTQITYSVKSTSTKAGSDTIAILNDIGAQYFNPLPDLINVKTIPQIVRDDVLIEIEVIAIK